MPQHHPSADPYGNHRVLSPQGASPAQAWKLNADADELYGNEILIDVESLSIDAASFRQIEGTSGLDDKGIARFITRTVATRGKQHNPVTGSGGVLMGKIAAIGSDLENRVSVKPGERIVSLASLTATPLRIDKVRKVHRQSAQLDVRGQAVLFEAYPYAALPTDFAPSVALATLGVCAAPALVNKVIHDARRVLILGAAGKSGLLCAAAVRERIGQEGVIVGIDSSDAAVQSAKDLMLFNTLVYGNAADPLSVRELCASTVGEPLFDMVISCVSGGDVEMGAVLATRPSGHVLFFSSSTNFNRAAYCAQLCSKELDLRIGGGYIEGQSDLALHLLRSHSDLAALFKKRYSQ